MNKIDYKILIVDDHTLSRTLLRIQLVNFGFRDENIADCPNAQKALEALYADKYNIVLVDWDMPDMDGLELLNAYQNNHSNKHEDTAFVMVSAEAQPERVLHALNSGIVSYIVKPIAQGDINEKMTNVLDWIEKS